MTCNNYVLSCSSSNKIDIFGCPSDRCPDFQIKRFDTRPSFKVSLEDCDGPIDTTDMVLEVSMWAKAKLKVEIDAEIDYISLADNIGFQQVMVGDIISIDQVRLPERMLVIAFDENNKLIQVQRGYGGTTPQIWKKGTNLRIFRVLNGEASTEMILQDITQDDGTILKDQLIQTLLIYDWQANDTCVPGCFWLEFKLLKPILSFSFSALSTPSITPSFTSPSLTNADFNCNLPDGIEWVRRFPVNSEGFLIQIVDSPITEF